VGWNENGQCNLFDWDLGPGPTVIELSSFTAVRAARKVILAWTTESENDNAGFKLYRA
jgi:hypothetical protein